MAPEAVGLVGSVVAALQSMLLPEGYPNSVSSDYLHYQLWDTLQGFMSYLKGVLCTLSFLRGIGVGSSGSDINSAMVVWIVRDAVGMVAGLAAGLPAFTRRFSDLRRLKQWRMWAEVARAAAGAFELASSTLPPQFFMPLVCLATSLNSFASVASSCTRGALVLHFSKDGNLADCAAKEGNQDRAVKLIGIFFAVKFLGVATESVLVGVAFYAAIAVCHLWFNWLAMRALQITDHELASAAVARKDKAQ